MSEGVPSQHRFQPELLQHAREMRQANVPAERILWSCLRNRRLDGLKFRRQVPVGRFVADFYCADESLIVELDGDSHNERQEYDEKRTEWLGTRGYRVVRFPNEDIYHSIDAVLSTILRECGRDVSRM